MTILDLMIYLTQPGGLFPEGVPDYGIPIVAEGLICIHAPLLVEEVNLDPYFKCEVIVNHLGTTEKTKKGHVEVFYVKA